MSLSRPIQWYPSSFLMQIQSGRTLPLIIIFIVYRQLFPFRSAGSQFTIPALFGSSPSSGTPLQIQPGLTFGQLSCVPATTALTDPATAPTVRSSALTQPSSALTTPELHRERSPDLGTVRYIMNKISCDNRISVADPGAGVFLTPRSWMSFYRSWILDFGSRIQPIEV
jgi:hypothetical protein